MKKGLLLIISIFVFTGIFNCVVLEPAYAQSHEHHEDHAEEKDGDCDVVCHTSHHLWNVDSSSTLIEQLLSEHEILSLSLDISPNPPLEGIFHPPATL